MTDLIPTKATFAPGEPIEVEVHGDAATVSLWRLERKVAEAEPVDGLARFAAQDEGGYGVEGGGATTALDVLADPLSRARYGFVARYEAGRDIDGVIAGCLSMSYAAPRLRMSTGNALPTRYVGRPDRASPAEGYAESHKIEIVAEFQEAASAYRHQARRPVHVRRPG